MENQNKKTLLVETNCLDSSIHPHHFELRLFHTFRTNF